MNIFYKLQESSRNIERIKYKTMTISEIINKLQNIKNEFGNVNVSTLNVSYNIEIKIEDYGTFIYN